MRLKAPEWVVQFLKDHSVSHLATEEGWRAVCASERCFWFGPPHSHAHDVVEDHVEHVADLLYAKILEEAADNVRFDA